MPGEPGLLLATEISRQNVAKEGWTTYYVSKDGNDGANGLKWESAFLTIQHAIDIAESWAKIYVKKGTYVENVVITEQEGIRIIGEKIDSVIIQPIEGAALWIKTSHTTIENLSAFGTLLPGMSIANADYVTIKNCIVDSSGFASFCARMHNVNYGIFDGVKTVSGSPATNGIGLSDCEYATIKNCLTDGPRGIYVSGTTSKSRIFENEIMNGSVGILLATGTSLNTILHNNIINNTIQVQDDDGASKWFENFYDDHVVDTNNDGLCDSPYIFAGGVDYSPVSRRNGWLQQSLGFGAGGVGEYQGDIEIWDSFEYVSDAALQTNWIEGGDAGNPTRSVTAYEGQYSMQTVIGAGTGYIYRLLAARNMKTLANIGIASQSSVGGDTFRFTLYDSSGNYSYWTQTCNAVPNTWTYHNINPHSVPTGASATPVDLEDIVEIRMANLTAASTYKFDFIKFSSLIASKIGIGYDGLDDNKETTSSVRGHLLAGLIHGTGTVVPDNSGLYDALLGNISAVNRVAGKTQLLSVSVTSAANVAADTVLATVTAQPGWIEKVILRADAAQTVDLTSCPIFGATGKVITFISAVDATQANLNATSKQLATDAPIYLDVGETIVMEHHGTGATALNLTVIILYKAVANGGYLV